MTRQTLSWYALSREAVPGVLLGVESTDRAALQTGPGPTGQSADLMVGFEISPSSNVIVAPCVALVDESHVAELFAWLHTYSTESFPISQFCRVETARQWESYSSYSPNGTNFDGAAWASLIVGEMLANAEQSFELKATPLAWASGCYSYAMARVLRTTPPLQTDWAKDAVERLRKLASDVRFVKRRNGVDALASLWAILSNGDKKIDGSNIHEVVAMVLSATDQEGALLLRQSPKLQSNSAEQRIHGFDEVVDQIRVRQPRVSAAPASAGALIAAAALVAGGGTTHIDLLRPHSAEFPDCLPWFGLLAGLAGPRAWDSDWLRLVKGVERQVRGGFSITDPVQCDLCWVEFEWLRQLSKSASVFIDLPKQHNRLLTIEIIPGATCQVRLDPPQQDPSRASKAEVRNDRLAEVSTDRVANSRISVPPDVKLRFMTVSDQLQALVRQMTEFAPEQSDKEQGKLFESPDNKGQKRQGSRAKKGQIGR